MKDWFAGLNQREQMSLLVLGFGVYGLLNAATLGGELWQGVVCHV